MIFKTVRKIGSTLQSVFIRWLRPGLNLGVDFGVMATLSLIALVGGMLLVKTLALVL